VETPVVATQTTAVTEPAVKTDDVEIAETSSTPTVEAPAVVKVEAKVEPQPQANDVAAVETQQVETKPVVTKTTETKVEEPKAADAKVDLASIVETQVTSVTAEAVVVAVPSVESSVTKSVAVPKAEAAKTETLVEPSVAPSAEVKEAVKATASAPMARPAAIAKPQATVQTVPTTPQITDAVVVSKPKAASRFGSMVSSDMTKPVVEVREQVAVPKGREYENTANEESTAKIKLANGAESDMARP
jgi:ribonuclease E